MPSSEGAYSSPLHLLITYLRTPLARLDLRPLARRISRDTVVLGVIRWAGAVRTHLHSIMFLGNKYFLDRFESVGLRPELSRHGG